jgi:putative addiction module component (TIGR02574 family)
MNLTEVKQQIAYLSPQERADLQEFLSSLDDNALSTEWYAEITKRRADFDEERVQFLSQEELFAKFRAKS